MSKIPKLEGRPSPALVISLIALFVALGSGAYAANKIGTNQIKGKAVTTGKLAGKAVTTGKLAGKGVTTGKLAGQAVSTNKLKDASVSESKLGQGAVETDKLADSAVTNSKLNGTSVGTNKLKDDSVSTDKLQNSAVGTDKIADGAVTSGKVSSDIPYRRTLQSTFTLNASYQSLVSFGDAELQGRCNTAGANGFMQLRVISPINGAQADMTATGPGGVPQFANSGQLGPNVGLEIGTVLLGNFNSPGVGSARVAARAPDGTALLATVGSHSLGGGACAFNALVL
ncbi:MAG: hypothetical protein ACERKT_08245 [Acidobacteriota bacterium]